MRLRYSSGMTVSPQSLANLRNGRPRAFTDAQALAILRERISAGAGTTVPKFIEYESQPRGCLPHAVSIPTLHALLRGRMYPDLIDPDTGQKFDYSKVPRAPVGQPSRFNEDGIDPITKERRRGVPPLRQWLLDRVMEDARRLIDARIAAGIHLAQGEVFKLTQRVKAIEERVSQFDGMCGGGRLKT